MHYSETELMLLLFAFTKIYVDDLADIRLKLSICKAVDNVRFLRAMIFLIFA